METERITYSDFQKHLLYRIAVLSGGDFEHPVLVEDAISYVRGRYPISWISAVVIKLEKSGFIEQAPGADDNFSIITDNNLSLIEKIKSIDSGKENAKTHYLLTEAGLEEAEMFGRFLGFDLWEEIDKYEQDGPGEHISESGRIVELDQTSQELTEVKEEVASTIRKVRSDNTLMASKEGQQRIAELEAGERLIQAEQVNEGLLTRTLVPALLWTARKVRDEGTGAAIKVAVTKLFSILTSG